MTNDLSKTYFEEDRKMKSKQKIAWMVVGTLMFMLTGCKTLQETAESKEVTQPEGLSIKFEVQQNW
jgi:hypothetical protein